VDAGDYSSNSEVVRDALRDWTHKRNLREQSLNNLRKLWQEAVADDTEGLDPDAVFRRLESKYDGLSKAKER
jgi:antitoxin ParD1/3/4